MRASMSSDADSDLITQKLFNCRQRNGDGVSQLLAAIEGAADDRDKERTWAGLEYGLRESQQTDRGQLVPESIRRRRVRFEDFTHPAPAFAAARQASLPATTRVWNFAKQGEQLCSPHANYDP
jgi:hypothetical protein